MDRKGITLVELLVALVISAILIGGTYRTFISQGHTYTVQEQVVEMQQNVRIAITEIMREIRMAGFGGIQSYLTPTGQPNRTMQFGGLTFTDAVNPDTPVAGALTILSAIRGSAQLTGMPANNQIRVSSLTDENGNLLFDTGNRRYISVGGIECHEIAAIEGGTKTITLSRNLGNNYKTDGSALVYPIRAITYQIGAGGLKRDENLGEGQIGFAEDIENIGFVFFDTDGNPTANPLVIRSIRVTITAKTNMPDPELKEGDGYRRRPLSSNILLRNAGL